jgi:hypothetical protein
MSISKELTQLIDPGKEAFEMARRAFFKNFCGGPGGGFYKKNPLAVGDNKKEKSK